MGRSTCILRGKAAPAVVLALAILLQPALSALAATADRFAGYTPAVRGQAERVVAAAAPGNDAALDKEVRALRKLMYAQGILSVNAIPELVFEKSLREGWRSRLTASLRIVTAVSPLSAPAWGLLVKDDILDVRMDDLPRDVSGLAGATRQFAPGLFGFVAWLASYLSAAICWFVAWASIALFLRVRPSLEADLSRIVAVPLRDVVAVVLAMVVFVLPLLGGQGLAVAACFWLVLSAGYLRRGEIVIATTVVVLLAVLLWGGGVIRSLDRVGSDVRRGGWIGGEGYVAPERPVGPSARPWAPLGPSASWMANFAKARRAMVAGDPVSSERLWTELIRDGKGLPEVYNNRGVSLAMQGKTAECLADFETALSKRPRDGAALWNAYQIYLQTFNLERARVVQPLAWDSLRKMSPYSFRPADMESGEWVCSPLPAMELWRPVLESDGGPASDVGRGDIFAMYFRPLKPPGAFVFLVMVFLAGAIWKVLSMRVWVHSTCRGCGARTLIAGAQESLDLCNTCRGQAGAGGRSGLERNRRTQGIGMHRRYARICSVLVPGSGALWAGKEIRVLIFGIVLALSLAGVSASAGPRAGGAIFAELRNTVTLWAAGVSALLWVGGAVWGVRSFDRFQRRYTLGSGRG